LTVLEPSRRGPYPAVKYPRPHRTPFRLYCDRRLPPTQRVAGFFTELGELGRHTIAYARELLPARKAPDKNPKTGFWKRVGSILTYLDLLSLVHALTRRTELRRNPSKPSAVDGRSETRFSVSTTRAQHDQKSLADDEEVLPQRPILNVIEIKLEHTFVIYFRSATDLPRAG
jgi:hypothetical protein